MGENIFSSLLENNGDVANTQVTDFFPSLLDKAAEAITGGMKKSLSELVDDVKSNFSSDTDLGTIPNADTDRIVMWVRRGSKDAPDLTPIEGTKAIRLSPVDKVGLVPIFYWDSGEYHFSKIEDNYLTSMPFENAQSKFNFLDDLEQVINCCNLYSGKSAAFNTIIDNVITFSTQCKKMDWIDISLKINEFNSYFQINLNDRPESIQRLSDAIFSVINPINLETKTVIKEETLILPLSYDWFVKNDDIKEVWNNYKDLQMLFTGSSGGEGLYKNIHVSIDNEFKENIDFIKTLQKKVKEKKMDDPESLWLLQIGDNLDWIKRFIYIHNDGYAASSGSWICNKGERYPNSGSIGLLSTFANLISPPLLTIILHELNQASAGFFATGLDTHISPLETKNVWTNMCTNLNKKDIDIVKYIDTVSENVTDIDELYQSKACISLTVFAIFCTFFK